MPKSPLSHDFAVPALVAIVAVVGVGLLVARSDMGVGLWGEVEQPSEACTGATNFRCQDNKIQVCEEVKGLEPSGGKLQAPYWVTKPRFVLMDVPKKAQKLIVKKGVRKDAPLPHL